MRLAYLPVNQAWIFVFGGSPIRLDGEDMFYPSRELAVESAKRHGLTVDRAGAVNSIPEVA